MSIEINNLHGSSIGSATNTQQAEALRSQQQPAPQGGVASSDTVHLTDSAKRLHQLESKLHSLPVVDAKRVEDVRESIAQGTHDVDADNVAEKLLEFEGQLA